MRKLIYYVASSEDLFIAEKNGGIEWLEDPKWKIDGEDFGYAYMYASIDTTLMGYNTYAKILEMNVPFPYTEKQNYVFTSHPDPLPCDEVCFVQTDAVRFTRKCKDAEGENIWLIGGGKLAGTLLEASLIDEIILTKVPVKLGEGIPLFGAHSFPQSASLCQQKHYTNGFLKEVWRFES